MRIAAVAALACVASWIGLLIGAGNVGLQRSVAVSPLTLLELPLALGLSSALAFMAPLLPGVLTDGPLPIPWRWSAESLWVTSSAPWSLRRS